MNRFKVFSSVIIAAFFLFSVGILNAQSVRQSFKPAIAGTSGGNIAMAVRRSDGKMVFSGGFDVINGHNQSYIAVFNEDGTLDESFKPGIFANNASQSYPYVNQIVPQPDGKLIIAGNFTHINGVATRWLARLNANGSLDTTFNTGTGPNSTVSDVKLLPDGKILICGYFSTYNNQPANRFIRLNADGTLDQTFTYTQFGFYVQNIIVQPDGKIMAIGEIFSETTGDFLAIVRLNANGSRDNSFNPGTSTGKEYITTMALQPDGKILISGAFDIYNGVVRRGMARINPNGSLDMTFNASVIDGNSPDSVTYLLQNNGQIIIGGSFDSVNGTVRANLARLNSDGTLDQSYAPVFDQNGSNTSVSPLFITPDQKVLISGSFMTINDSPFPGVAKINTDGTPDPSYGMISSAAGSIVATATQADGKIVIAGSFSSINGVFNHGIARLNADGSLDSSFNSGRGLLKTTPLVSGLRNGSARAVAVQNDGKILLGGNFSTYNNIYAQDGFVRINPDGSHDPSFSMSSPAGQVDFILVQPDNKIITVATNSIRRYHPNGTLDSEFAVGTVNDRIREIVLQPDGKIILGGFFTSIGGVSRNRIARLNANGSLDTGFNVGTGADSYINSVGLKNDGKIVIAGNFTSVNGTLRARIAQLNSDGSLDTAFNPGSGADSYINKILIQPDGKTVIGGNFNTFNNVSRKKLARLFPDGSLDSTFAVGFNLTVAQYLSQGSGSAIYTLTQNGNKLTIGGYFTRINDHQVSGLAQLQTGKTIFDFDGDGKTDIGIFRPSTGAWWLNSSSTNAATAVGFGAADDKLTPADFTGDGKTDHAFFRPSNSTWYVLRSEDYSFYGFQFGANGDIPAPGDFDGDGKTDAAVFRPSSASWYILRSSDGAVTSLQFGVAEDKPVVADYDGDGKADIGVFRPTPSEWWILKSTGGVFSVQFGQAGDKAVPGDYTGDGKADVAFWRPSSGTWYILRSEDSSFYGFPFGNASDIPAPGDYDGDGKTDAAVFRDSNASWYLLRSTSGFTGVAFGSTGDKPIPNAFVR